MRTLSIGVPRLTNVLLALFIFQFSSMVQGRTPRSSGLGGRIADPINSPDNLNIVPRQWSTSNIEYRISGPNSLEMIPRQSSAPKMENEGPSADHLADRLPDSWRVIPRRLEPPKIEMQLLKGHVLEGGNFVASVEYRFSDNYEDVPPKSDDRNADNGSGDRKGYQDKINPRKPSGSGLDSRTIFQVPLRPCAPGERRDPLGKCRRIY